VVRVAPVAGIAIHHELMDGIELDRSMVPPWAGSVETLRPLVVRHEVGDARPAGLTQVLDIPPWCTFLVDERGEPASLFHGVFGEVDRLLSCEEPGSRYVVRYASQPATPVVPLQSELAAFSFALAARSLGLIAHACAFVAPNGNGVLCPGVSGTGKTTLARLLAAHEPGARVLTDDRAVVTLRGGDPIVWGSPWPGAAQIAESMEAPLSTVLFIRHGGSCVARTVPPREAFRRIVNTLSIPLWEPARCAGALEVVDAIVTRARLVEVAYPLNAGTASWLIETAQGADQ
jgi:hypothetical protein